MKDKNVIIYPIHVKDPILPENYGKKDVTDIIIDNFKVEERDIFVITSKITGILEGRCVKLDDVEVSEKSRKIAEKYKKHPGLIELIRREGRVSLVVPAGRILKNKKYEHIHRSLATPGLTEEEWQKLMDFACTYRWMVPKFGFLADNAGIDCQNVPEGYAVMLPLDPMKSAIEIRTKIKERTGKNIAVLIADSFGGSGFVGSMDLAIGYSGIDPVERNYGRMDVYGRLGTGGFANFIYPITAMAGAVMGGSDESTPIVAIRGFKYMDERKEDEGKNTIHIPFAYQVDGFFWAILSTIRYFFIWLRA